MTRRTASLALVLLTLAALAPSAAAQGPRASDLVTWRVRADRAAPGAAARLVFDAEVAEGWRMYALGSPVGIPLTVALDALPAGVTAGGLRQSGTHEGFDEAFDSAYRYFAGPGRLVQTLRVGAAVPRTTHEVTGAVRYAVCDDTICLPPVRTAFRVSLVVD